MRLPSVAGSREEAQNERRNLYLRGMSHRAHKQHLYFLFLSFILPIVGFPVNQSWLVQWVRLSCLSSSKPYSTSST